VRELALAKRLHRHFLSDKGRVGTREREDYHQPPDVNYIEAFAKVNFPCGLNSESLVCKGNYRSETGVNSSIEMAGGWQPSLGFQDRGLEMATFSFLAILSHRM